MTTGPRRSYVLTRLRDHLMVGNLVVRSPAFIEELSGMRRGEGGDVQAEGHAKDDRVLAAALAVESWLEQAMPIVQHLPQRGADGAPLPEPVMPPGGQRLMQRFFSDLGVTR
jgi:hypothetical protein